MLHQYKQLCQNIEEDFLSSSYSDLQYQEKIHLNYKFELLENTKSLAFV